MPHVQHLIDTLASGGAQSQVLQVADGLHDHGWRAAIAYYNDRAGQVKPAGRAPVTLLARRSYGDPAFARALWRIGSREHTDVLHAWLDIPMAYAGLLRQAPRRAPVVCAARNEPGWYQHEPLARRASILGAWLGDVTTSNSRATIAWLARLGVPRDRLVFVPNILASHLCDREPSTADAQGAALAAAGYHDPEPPLLCVARFDAHKNQLGLVQALTVLQRQGVTLPPLLCVGSVASPERLQATKDAAAAAGVRLVVAPPQRGIEVLMEAARAVVLPSLVEGTPNVVLEALALGRPVVATRAGETASLAEDGALAELADPGDVPGLARALADALARPAADIAARGEASRASIRRRFGADAVLPQWIDVYRTAMTLPGPGWWRRLRQRPAV